MALLVAGADEVVERHVEALPHLAEHALHFVAVGERILPLLDRFAKDVLRVLVVTHQKMGIEARQAAVARNDIGGDLFVSRAQMRPAIHEIDCRGQEIFHRSSHAFCANA